MKELRIRREQDEKDGVKPRKFNDVSVERYMNDPTLSDFEKLDLIKRKADYMELKANMNEKLIKVGSGVEGKSAVEKTIAVNDMYIEAITAKLRILDQI